LRKDVLLETYKLYDQINSIVADCEECEEAKHKKVRLEDICFQPLSPDNSNCAIQSIFQYWQNDRIKILESLDMKKGLSDQLDYLDGCMKNPFTSTRFYSCLSSFGSPIQPYMIVGSYSEEDYLGAGAVVITYVINNYIKNNKEYITKAMAWEGQVLDLLKNYSSPLINVYYTTERSIEDELERESKADIKIIAISYAMMFVYLTITLGKYTSLKPKVILVEMKIFLGLAGVILVLMSVFSSGGLFTYLGKS
jgi:Niemann-Pick C1 protein